MVSLRIHADMSDDNTGEVQDVTVAIIPLTPRTVCILDSIIRSFEDEVPTCRNHSYAGNHRWQFSLEIGISEADIILDTLF